MQCKIHPHAAQNMKEQSRNPSRSHQMPLLTLRAKINDRVIRTSMMTRTVGYLMPMLNNRLPYGTLPEPATGTQRQDAPM